MQQLSRNGSASSRRGAPGRCRAIRHEWTISWPVRKLPGTGAKRLPLSRSGSLDWLASPAPTEARPPPTSWLRWHNAVPGGPEFWDGAAFTLSLTEPHPDDLAILELLGEIGIVAAAASSQHVQRLGDAGRRQRNARGDRRAIAQHQRGETTRFSGNAAPDESRLFRPGDPGARPTPPRTPASSRPQLGVRQDLRLNSGHQRPAGNSSR